MERLLRVVIDHPIWVIAAVAGLTLLAASRIVDFRSGEIQIFVDPSVDSMLPRDDDDRRFYDRARRIFGSDETVMVGLVADDVFTPERLGAIARMTERIEEIEGVHHVLSLANALWVHGTDGELHVGPFYDEVPGTAEASAAVRRAVFDNPVYAGNLVGRDGRATALIVYLHDMPEREFYQRGIDPRVRAIAEEESGDISIWVSGGAHVKAETTRTVLEDLQVVVPLATLAMTLIAFWSFRSLRGVIVPMTTIGIALAWTLGVAAAYGSDFNLVTVVVPSLILVVGFAYAVHVLSGYYDALAHSETPALQALRDEWLPVVLTGLTTAAGFASLATSRLDAIRQFAVYSALGALFTTVVALTWAPALLQCLPRPEPRLAGDVSRRLGTVFERLARFDLRRRRIIVLVGFGVALLAAWGTTRIQISTEVIGNFREDSRLRRDFDALNETLEGANAFHVVLEAPDVDAFKEPANLLAMQRLQSWLEAQPEIGGTTSLVDHVMLIHRAFRGDDPAALSIPDSRRLVAQLLFFGGNEELERFVDSQYQTVSVLVRARVSDSGHVSALLDRIDAHLATLPQPLVGRTTGNAVLLARTADDIALGQALSLATAFAIIYVILALLFTSLRVGLYALVPNALPVLVYFGVLGWSGVTLNTTTGLVACLVLGIAVDDTIHFLARFSRTAKRAADEERGVIEALRSVGPPVTYTSLALCVGFLVLIFSQLRSQVDFGVLAASTLAFAWLVDVTFTPALAARMRIVTLWDVLSLDLGEDPHHSIPLFAGLRKTQARIVALMTSLQSFPRGHHLIEIGAEGDEMFVVIDGTLALSVPAADGRLQLSTAVRGDVLGEVALLRGRRTADVHAETDVRLMRFTNEDLARLQRRYPRTGAQVYRNLSRILADRVANTAPAPR